MLAFIRNVILRALSWLGFGRGRLYAVETRSGPIPLSAASLGSYVAEPPARPLGRAPEPAFTEALRPRRKHDRPGHRNPTLAQLRRRALSQLFDHFGLAMIPGEAWTALDDAEDPVAAFRQFAAWVGCDPELVRRNHAAQLARMQTAIDLLVNLHPIRQHLSAAGEDRIRRALTAADDAELATHARQIEDLAAIQACRYRAESLQPCAAYERFAGLIDDTCSDPLATTPSEIDDAALICNRILRAMHSYTNSRVKINEAAAEIARIWSSIARSDRDLDIRDGILFRADELDKTLRDDRFLTVTDVENLAAECGILLEDLRKIHGRYASHSDSDDSYIDEREAALKFFGFSPNSSPSEETIRRIFRKMWKKHNVDDPSHRVTEEQRLEN